MLSAKEKRFKRYWEDQRKGSKWSYIFVYTIGLSVIIFFLPLIISLVINVYEFFHLYELKLWQAVLLSVVVGFAASQFLWMKNESRWRLIIEKETNTDPSVY